MRILYFHQHFSTPEGGAGTRSYEFARRLASRGHAVTMVCGSYRQGHTGLIGPFARGRRTGTVDGIDVIEFDLGYSNESGFARRIGTFLAFALKSIGIALTHPADVVFATSTPLTAGIPGIFARWLRGRRFVFEVRDLWPELPREMGVITNPVVLAAMGVLEWVSYRSATVCVALAPGIAEGIERRGVDRSRIAVIPNGCDIGFFGAAQDAADSGEVAGIDRADFVAAYTGTHGIANGLDAALDAAAELIRRERSRIKMLFVGSGGRKTALVARAERDGLENCVFLDAVPKTELARLMQRVDVGMQLLDDVPAFYYGTSPNKFFDYLAQGKPVLVNYPGWVAEMVEDAACGWVVPPRDPVAFADALEDAQERKADLHELGARAARLAEDRFDRDDLAEDFISVLTRVQTGETAVGDIGAHFRHRSATPDERNY